MKNFCIIFFLSIIIILTAVTGFDCEKPTETDGYLRVQPKQGAYVCYGKDTPMRERDEIELQVMAWKDSGVTKEKLECILAQVYGGENND